MRQKNHTETLDIPDKVTVSAEKGRLTVTGPQGTLSRDFKDPRIDVSVQDREVAFKVKLFTRKEKKLVGTYMAHTKNMMKGADQGVEYRLKICSGHFPMNVAVVNNQLVVKNFLGEKVPRTLAFGKDVKVMVEGEQVVCRGVDKELVSQFAASVELLTKRTKFDRRIFQDGIYIVNKDGKEIK
jgi:large subunit ribosomal protein L6